MTHKLIPDLFKTEYSKLVAVLCKQFGLKQLEIAEDIAHDTFLLATESWQHNGAPENPVAWLYAVAKNKTRDFLKREILFEQKIAPQLHINQSESIDPDFSETHIKDSQLQMMFAICHPSIPLEAQTGLALRILCGFGIDEIAAAFLSSKSTINKRLYRAKEILRKENIPLELPPENTLEKRIDGVLRTLYLLFNEGYHATSKNQLLQKELCIDAMRLTKMLCNNHKTAKPQCFALLALMCFHASRFEARTDKAGVMILYEDQNRELWNEELIDKGNYYLIKSAAGPVTKYHLEARIAYWHSSKIEHQNKWEYILQLYNYLLQLEYSANTALNRTYALAKVQGFEIAITEALKLNLNNNVFYHALLGKLYAKADIGKAIKAYSKAMELSPSPALQKQLEKQLNELL